MGSITNCRNAGLPESLIIPIRPHDQPDSDGKGAGKAPAVPNPLHGWQPLSGWQKCTTPWPLKLAADMEGCNAGIVLGVHGQAPSGGHGYNFAAIDIDLDEGCEKHRNALIEFFRLVWDNDKLLIRDTVPWRAMLLVLVQNTYSPGHKQGWNLSILNPDTGGYDSIGKIELLTTGQQCVIAGTHPSGNPILWHRYHGTEQWTEPHLYDGIPVFADFGTLADNLQTQMDLLALNGFRYTRTAAGGGGGDTLPDADLVPEWLTTTYLCDFIAKTPNTRAISRDQYVAFMMAIGACKHGLETRYGKLSGANLQKLIDCTAKWAASWPGHRGKLDAFDSERAKVESDWFVERDGYRTGWGRLESLAVEFGWTDAAVTNARRNFTALPPPAPKAETEPPLVATADSELPFDPRRPGKRMAWIPGSEYSDVWVADYLLNDVGQVLAFLPGRGWLIWDGKRQGWVVDTPGNSIVQWRALMGIHEYASKFGSTWSPGAMTAMLSARKLASVLHILSLNLTKEESQVKSAMYHLQTQLGMFDLRAGHTIETPDKAVMFDTRYTGCAPDFVRTDTPLFDNLLDGLSNGNPDVIDWLWHYFGYCALGDPRADCFLVIWGSGMNGKSVLLNTLRRIFGDYHVALDSKVLLESGNRMHATSLHQLRDKRVALVSEMSHKEKWNESLLKQITGGDMIASRDIGQKASTFKSEASMLIVCNELPPFSAVSQAVLRRFRVVGTTRQPLNPDPALEEKIWQQESGAILGKIMQYAQKVYNPAGEMHQRIVLPPVPQAMLMEAATLLGESDPTYAWLNAECEFGPGLAESHEDIAVLKKRYELWLAKNNRSGLMPGMDISDKVFRAALRRIGGIQCVNDRGQSLTRVEGQGLGRANVPIARGIRLKVKEIAAA